MGWTRAHAGLRLMVVGTVPVVALGGVGRPSPAAVEGWNRYVAVAEKRMAEQMDSGPRFLGQDYEQDADRRRRALLDGELLVDQIEEPGSPDAPIRVPGARVHHWRGAVLIRGANLGELVADLQSRAPREQPGVVEARVLDRGPGSVRLFLKVERTQIISVVYETEHAVTFRDRGDGLASSASAAVRIDQILDDGTPQARRAEPGEDFGLLWRWRAYWRYRQVGEGVLAECESLSLSRTVPAVARYLVEPLIRRTAREAMVETLRGMRDARASLLTRGAR